VKIVKDSITISELKELSVKIFDNFVKAVVDIDQEFLAVDAELHSDLEALLLREGSKQKSLWGINLYPAIEGSDFIEYDSMINLRPSQGNRSRGVESEHVRHKIVEIVTKRITR
jgi:hypothetical protein